MELDVRITRARDGWTIVEPAGEIDVYTSPRLRETLVEAFDGGSRNVLVSLERVDFIDSTGLGVLIGGLKRADQIGGRFEIASANRQFLKLLRITGLDKIFAVRPPVGALGDGRQEAVAL